MAQQVLYVDPIAGQDNRSGQAANQALKTLTAALARSQAETVIHLQAGSYTADTGEQFPLTIPAGCRVVGQTGGDRPAAVLKGGGGLQHPGLGQQSVTCILQAGALLARVTVVNSQPEGVGVWMESGRSHLQQATVMQCAGYGAVVLRQALPTVTNCLFRECGQAGVAWFHQGKGQLQAVTCEHNGTGLQLNDSAAPLVLNCRITHNQIGIAIADTAHPVLRQTHLSHNRVVGLRVSDQATADLGQAQSLGNNVIRNNGVADLQNQTPRSLVCCHNDVLPQRLQGRVELIASQIPAAAVVPEPLFEQLAAMPPAAPPPLVATEEDTGPEGGGAALRFRDLAGHWARSFIDGLAAAGAVAGFEDNTFRPDQGVTRAQFAALVLASFADQPRRYAPVSFQDVPPDFWGREALTQAQQRGFLRGFPDGTVRPHASMTRIQAIVAIANGLDLTGGRVDDISIYRDRAQVPSYAVEALATATRRRLVVNHPEPLRLRPLEAITRAEAAALVYQGRVVLGTASAIPSPYIVRPDTTQPRFSDLPGHWAADFIRALAEANLVSGLADGRFAPDQPMTRAQFAALIVQALQPTPERDATVFRDVPADFWAAAAIQTAYRSGYLSGFPDGTFGPQNPLLRVQVWVALVSGLRWETATVDLNPLGRFQDYMSIPRYALRATAIAAQKQLVTTYPEGNHLYPNQVANRADVCVSVYQALVKLGRLPAIASPFVGYP